MQGVFIEHSASQTRKQSHRETQAAGHKAGGMVTQGLRWATDGGAQSRDDPSNPGACNPRDSAMKSSAA